MRNKNEVSFDFDWQEHMRLSPIIEAEARAANLAAGNLRCSCCEATASFNVENQPLCRLHAVDYVDALGQKVKPDPSVENQWIAPLAYPLAALILYLLVYFLLYGPDL